MPDSFDSLQFEFNEGIDSDSFDPAADVVSFTGPLGALPLPTQAQWISSTVLAITFPEQTASGRYTMTIGPEIEDSSGMAMDQDEDLVPGEPIQDRYAATWISVPARLASSTCRPATSPVPSRRSPLRSMNGW